MLQRWEQCLTLWLGQTSGSWADRKWNWQQSCFVPYLIWWTGRWREGGQNREFNVAYDCSSPETPQLQTFGLNALTGAEGLNDPLRIFDTSSFEKLEKTTFAVRNAAVYEAKVIECLCSDNLTCSVNSVSVLMSVLCVHQCVWVFDSPGMRTAVVGIWKRRKRWTSLVVFGSL